MGIGPFLLTQGLFGLPYLIGIIVIAVMAKGAARVLGTIGCGLLLIGHGLQSVWSYLMPQLMSEFRLSIMMASIPNVVLGLVGAIGMILVICAVVAGRRAKGSPTPPPRPMGQPLQPQQPVQGQPMQPGQPPAPGPYGQQPGGPYQPGPQ